MFSFQSHGLGLQSMKAAVAVGEMPGLQSVSGCLPARDRHKTDNTHQRFLTHGKKIRNNIQYLPVSVAMETDRPPIDKSSAADVCVTACECLRGCKYVLLHVRDCSMWMWACIGRIQIQRVDQVTCKRGSISPTYRSCKSAWWYLLWGIYKVYPKGPDAECKN